MKVGDKLICKRRTDFIDGLIVGKKYTINRIHSLCGTDTQSIVIMKELVAHFNCSNPIHSFYIFKYFYTTQEERKIKLKQILDKTN